MSLRPVRTRRRVMSLAVLNEDRDIPQRYRTFLEGGAWRPVRICTAAETARRERATEAEALRAAGLDEDLADAMTGHEHDAALRNSHKKAMAQVGRGVGPRLSAVAGVAFFGPVIAECPRGEDAVRLWDGLRLVAGISGFYELKRSRDRRPVIG